MKKEVGRKYIAEFTTSSLCSKGRLKGLRVIVILFIFISLVLDIAHHLNDGIAFARDFTSIVMLFYFINVLGASYKLTTSSDITQTDTTLSNIASALFAISTTSALFDTIIFWTLLYPTYHPRITFYIINVYVLNLVIMILEILWSLMIIPASRFIYALIGSGAYIGVYYLWDYFDKDYVVNEHVLPHIGIPKKIMLVLTVVVVYNASFWVMYGFVAIRTRVYNHGLFSREETFHILDTQTFE